MLLLKSLLIVALLFTSDRLHTTAAGLGQSQATPVPQTYSGLLKIIQEGNYNQSMGPSETPNVKPWNFNFNRSPSKFETKLAEGKCLWFKLLKIILWVV